MFSTAIALSSKHRFHLRVAVVSLFFSFSTANAAQAQHPTATPAEQTSNTQAPSTPTSAKCNGDECIIEVNINEVYKPKVTNSLFNALSASDQFYDSPYQVSLFSAENGEDSARLWSQTKGIFSYGFIIIGAIALLPEDVSNWEDGEIFGKWGDNVKNGPVWDRDGLGLNVIGHGYFGGVYYQVARKSGYRQWDAFMYATLMSTFYWEYGIEAFAEVPSIQDLVLTPVLGWAYGEWAYQTEQSILQGGSTVMGSDTLGSVSLALLDPIDSLSVGINNLFGHEIFIAGTGYLDVKDMQIGNSGDSESYVQMGVSYQFGSGKHYNKSLGHQSAVRRYKNDPVDYSIIGMSLGYGGVNLDDSWEIEGGAFTEASLGLYFSKSFSTRLLYNNGSMNLKNSTSKERYENYSINSQYYFNTEKDLRPFVSLGFGEMMRAKDNDKTNFQVHSGLGLHYQLTNTLAFQVDGRYYYSTSTNTEEKALAGSLVYRLGRGERN